MLITIRGDKKAESAKDTTIKLMNSLTQAIIPAVRRAASTAAPAAAQSAKEGFKLVEVLFLS